jgi:ribosome biogenesis protein MAK21
MCSRASYYLLQLLQAHPSMKVVVVQEVIGLVLRPHTAPTSSTKMPIRTLHRPKHKTKGINAIRSNRSSGTSHARYYATITFNQIVLTPRDRDVASQLIHVYFEMFKELLGEGKEMPDEEEDPSNEKEVRMDKVGRVMDNRKGKGKRKLKEAKGAAGFAEVEDAHSKLVSAILTGVNRALPFAKIDSDDTR